MREAAIGSWDNPDRPPMPWVGVSAETIRPEVTIEGVGKAKLTFPAGCDVHVADDVHAALTTPEAQHRWPGLAWRRA